MDRRPPMTKVVQMLEGVCDVPQPPTTSQRIFHIYSTLLKSSSEEEELVAPEVLQVVSKPRSQVRTPGVSLGGRLLPDRRVSRINSPCVHRIPFLTAIAFRREFLPIFLLPYGMEKGPRKLESKKVQLGSSSILITESLLVQMIQNQPITEPVANPIAKNRAITKPAVSASSSGTDLGARIMRTLVR
ncbi:hypothetical protein CK203_080066 [Vitis vinifera]|uniref:Uncharacterized protein n=1 Tax=Vitis vinifera TaxID=29760 RepID=A0A438D9W8_VITVI|nr:hypothetical protein CK203_080066 [Vitis vinifera]